MFPLGDPSRHTGWPGERNFVCTTCYKSFKYKAGLTAHVRYECGKAPQFLCPHCPYRAHHKSQLKRHIVLKHRDFIQWFDNFDQFFFSKFIYLAQFTNFLDYQFGNFELPLQLIGFSTKVKNEKWWNFSCHMIRAWEVWNCWVPACYKFWFICVSNNKILNE